MTSGNGEVENEHLRYGRRLLGVQAGASVKEVRTAFVRRAKVVHPDRFDPRIQTIEWTEANALLRELNDAYRVVLAATERPQTRTASAPPKPEPAKPPPRRTPGTYPGTGRTYRKRPPEPHSPIGFFDLGIFLLVCVCQFLATNIGAVILLLVLLVVDFRQRWANARRTREYKKYLLLPRQGWTFVFMPMWIASIVFGFFGFGFPWQWLGIYAVTVGSVVFALVAVLAAGFFVVDWMVGRATG